MRSTAQEQQGESKLRAFINSPPKSDLSAFGNPDGFTRKQE
jgi:hypothetical protein